MKTREKDMMSVKLSNSNIITNKNADTMAKIMSSHIKDEDIELDNRLIAVADLKVYETEKYVGRNYNIDVYDEYKICIAIDKSSKYIVLYAIPTWSWSIRYVQKHKFDMDECDILDAIEKFIKYYAESKYIDYVIDDMDNLKYISKMISDALKNINN